MGGHEIGVGSGFERDLQEIAGIEAENRAPVGRDIADAGEPRRHAVDGLEVGRIDQVVDFAGAIALLVDGGDFDLEHETHRGAARRRYRLRHRLLDVVAQAIKAGLGGHELLLELGAPGRMGEVAGGDHADALAAGPCGKMLEIEIPARGPRIFRVNVQVRVEAHPSHALFARAAWTLRRRSVENGTPT